MRNFGSGSFSRITVYFLTGAAAIYLILLVAVPDAVGVILGNLKAQLHTVAESAPKADGAPPVAPRRGASPYVGLIFALLAFIPVAVFGGAVSRAMGNLYMLIREGLLLPSSQRRATKEWTRKFRRAYERAADRDKSDVPDVGVALTILPHDSQPLKDGKPRDEEGLAGAVILRYSTSDAVTRLVRLQGLFFLSYGYVIVVSCAAAWCLTGVTLQTWIMVDPHASPYRLWIGIAGVAGGITVALLGLHMRRRRPSSRSKPQERASLAKYHARRLLPAFIIYPGAVGVVVGSVFMLRHSLDLVGYHNDVNTGWCMLGFVCLLCAIPLATHSFDLRHRFLRYLYRIAVQELHNAVNRHQIECMELQIKLRDLDIRARSAG